MIHFTKEELEDIHQSYEECFRPFTEREQSIVKKLEFMIENYCDHEWENYYVGSIIHGIYCQKCNTRLKGS